MALEKKQAVSIATCKILVGGVIVGEMTKVSCTYTSAKDNVPVLSDAIRVTRAKAPDFTFTAEAALLYDESMNFTTLRRSGVPFLMEGYVTDPETGSSKVLYIPDCEISEMTINLDENSATSIRGNCGDFDFRP